MEEKPILNVVFFRTETGYEPVREWLKSLDKQSRKVIGEDIKLVQFRWPIGMPLVKKMEKDLWEVRSYLTSSKISRVFFSVHSSEIALLHGFIKKSKKTPQSDLKLARSRKNLWQSG